MGNNKFKILIVEDDHTILNFVQTLLEATVTRFSQPNAAIRDFWYSILTGPIW